MTNQPFAGAATQPYTVVQNIQFPITVSFKKISLTNQASVTDASGPDALLHQAEDVQAQGGDLGL